MQDDVPPYKLFNYTLPYNYSPTEAQEFTTVLLIDVLAAHRRGYNPDKILTIGTGAGRLPSVYMRVYDGQTTILSVDSTQLLLSSAIEGHKINGYSDRSVYYIGKNLLFLQDINTKIRFSLIAYNPYETGVLDPDRVGLKDVPTPEDRCLAEFILMMPSYLHESGRAFIVIRTTKELSRHQRAAGQLGLYFTVAATRMYANQGQDQDQAYSVIVLSRQKLKDCRSSLLQHSGAS